MNIVFHKENQDWLDALNIDSYPDDDQHPVVMSVRSLTTCCAADIIRLHKIGASLLKLLGEETCTTAYTDMCSAAYIHEHYVRALAQLSVFNPKASNFGVNVVYGRPANFLPRWTFGDDICTISLRNIRVWKIKSMTVPVGVLLHRDLGHDYLHIDQSPGGVWGPSILANFLSQNKYAGPSQWVDSGSGYYCLDTARVESSSATQTGTGTTLTDTGLSATAGTGTWYTTSNHKYLQIFPRNHLVKFKGEALTLERVVFGKDLSELVFKSKIGRLLFECTCASLRARMKRMQLAASANISVATGITLKATLPISLPIQPRTVSALVRQLEFKEMPRKRKRGKLWI